MKNTHALLVATIWLSLSAANLLAAPAEPKPTHLFSSARKPGDIDRVVVTLEVGGDVSEVVQGKVERTKMSVTCKLSYDERTLEVSTESADRLRSIRSYDQVDAVIKLDVDEIKPALRPSRQLIGVEIELPGMTLFSPNGTLTRDELELVDILGNSLLLDRLLPEKAVAVGQTWKHSEKLMVALLGLDAASMTDVTSVLTDVTETAARIELSGRVEGALGGVSTEIDLKAKYRFDRRNKRIDWFALLVKEKRSIGHVERGWNAVARLQVRILPQPDSTRLDEAKLKGLPLEPTAELNQLSYESPGGGWRITHDRCWYTTGDHSDLTILRMLDRGELVAQCNISQLPKLAAATEVTMAEFQGDVRQALGKSFGEFVEAGQWGSDANYRVYRVVVRGKVEDLPIQWNYYLVTDRHGCRMTFAFSVGSELVERFDEADRKLVGSLRFTDLQVASNGKR